ncbi:alpha-(1,3)-fucosyltransferase C [Lingula anatina]|uniref:Fucosyltransferase n=1 Tax=Lingula anatina TaxID=7574 RepID=A0A1S3K480_LINAN|nr:alpha-(1,3)-fucosyltransferase C [Lingula anatina]|eukprot:XP_013417443.1 alpha-(1,3)-fucosyltransferase C [Lingula anatina]
MLAASFESEKMHRRRRRSTKKYLYFGIISIVIIVLIALRPWTYSLKWKNESKYMRCIHSNEEKDNSEVFQAYPEYNKDTKIILLWTHFFGSQTWFIPKLGRYILDRNNCSQRNCLFVTDRCYLDRSDALLFHAFQITQFQRPAFRLPHQRWAVYALESPCYHDLSPIKGTPWNGDFNWTISYRFNADITVYHGEIFKRPSPVHNDYDAIMKLKKKQVVWMVSNCQTESKREKYVEELAKYIPVDIIGACGKLQCPHGEDCLKKIATEYKFHLSFENSLSEDYMTEKFFKTLPYPIVNVVRNGANMEAYQIPSDWYINTRDFESPKKLAEYLNALDKDDTKYIKYLKAKEQFSSIDTQDEYCKLCEKLHDPKAPVKQQTDLYTWWNMDNSGKSKACKEPSDLNF